MREFFFVLFILSGTIKSVIPPLKNLPDITAIALAFLTLYTVYDLFTKKLSFKLEHLILVAYLLFYYIVLIASAAYSPSISYKYTKIALFSLNIISFAYPLYTNKFSLERSLQLFIKFGLFIVVCFLIYYPLIKTGYLKVSKEEYETFKGMYLNAGIVSGLVVIILNTLKIDGFHPRFFYTIFLLLVLVVSGARGPLLFCLVFLLLHRLSILHRTNFLRARIRLKRILVTLLGLIILVTSAVVLMQNKGVSDLVEKRLSRVSGFIEGKKSLSIDKRQEHISFTIGSFENNYINLLSGFGVGSYSILKNSEDRKDHPHNFILESVFEVGLAGSIVLFAYLAGIFFSIITKKSSVLYIFVIGYVFLNSLKSSSIVEIRILFAVFAISLLSSYAQNKSNGQE